ncbi:MAG: site-specific DNA-methyltransferase [Zoogloeaceae bacterium]|nr:site-specific DNA-methyltransferase [Zoogloeaceae bacterium]
MSRLTDLIAQVKAKDAQVGADLEHEFKTLSSRLPFGLNFERHRPEAVELPLRPIRRGDKVRVLPERGSAAKGDQRLWQVKKIRKAGGGKVAELKLCDAAESQKQIVALDDLMVVAEFKDTIYPGLVSTGKVMRGGDKPCHTVINGENYHVLKALTYTHRGKVDAIYIDPPYNTGAKDWKYNNDYVEGDDLYRHSKWLAMMERRLIVARQLLNPADSVLIITIDEKEYLRLGLLLEQVFPEAQIQMISSVINPSGSSRTGSFSRSDEYIFFVFVGGIDLVPTQEDMLRPPLEGRAVRWDGLARRGATGKRIARPNLFYPVFCHAETGKFHSVGEPIPLGASRASVKAPQGTFAIWPIAQNGSEVTWGISHVKFKSHIANGYLKFGPYTNGSNWRAIYHIQSGTIDAIKNGSIDVLGKDSDGALILGTLNKPVRPMTTWNKQSHSAGDYVSHPGRFDTIFTLAAVFCA